MKTTNFLDFALSEIDKEIKKVLAPVITKQNRTSNSNHYTLIGGFEFSIDVNTNGQTKLIVKLDKCDSQQTNFFVNVLETILNNVSGELISAHTCNMDKNGKISDLDTIYIDPKVN